MSRFRSWRLASWLLPLALAVPGMAAAQSTDGYYSMQVVPVVVDTASFVQRFTFQNAQDQDLSLKIRYFPATGTSATAMQCPNLFVALGGQRTVPACARCARRCRRDRSSASSPSWTRAPPTAA
jgi:hypothetical protein